MRKTHIYLVVSLVIIGAGVVDAVAQRRRVARVSGGTAQRAAVRRALPSNYGSLQAAAAKQAVKPSVPHIQPVAEDGSHTTYRGGEVEWATTPGGETAVRGETARGRSYGGVQSSDGKRAAVAEMPGDGVVVRDRSGETAAYRKVGDDWKEVKYAGVPYYYHAHRWYHPYYYGGHVYYEEVYPPDEATVDELPEGAVVVERNGSEYILWDGVYYEKVDGKYKVVDLSQNNEVAGGAIGVLDRMNIFLAGQKTLVVLAEELISEPVAQGQFKTARIWRETAISRPDKLRVRRKEGEGPVRQFWYDGAQATLHTADQRFYGQVAFSGDLHGLLDMLRSDYAVTLPLSDLLQAGLVDSLRQRLRESTYVGREELAGRDCHHIGLKTDDVEGDLWIDALDTAPYPRKVVFRYPGTPGKPSYEAKLTKWRIGMDLSKDGFVFTPAEGDKRIDMVPVSQSARSE